MKRKILSAALALCMLTCAFPASALADEPATPTPVVESSATTPTDETKADETQADETKADETKADETQTDETQADETKADETKADETQTDETQADETKADEPKADETKADETKADETKADEPKTEDKAADSDVESEPVMALFSLAAPRAASVASIGSTPYSTLAEAVSAANNGDTIKLLGDLTVANLPAPPASKSITIDLDGKTLTTNQATSTKLENGQSLTVKNGSIVAKGFKDGTVSFFNVQTNASVTLDAVKVDSTSTILYPQGDAATVNVLNGSELLCGVFAVATNANSVDNYGIIINLKDSTFTSTYGYNTTCPGDSCPVLINVPGTLNMDKCKVNGTRQAVVVRAGTANITNSEIKLDQKYTDDRYLTANWDSGTELPTAALVVGNRNNNYQAPATCTVTDTKIEAKKDGQETDAIYSYAMKDEKVDRDVTLKLTGNTSVSGTTTFKSEEGVTPTIVLDDVKLNEQPKEVPNGYKAVESDGTWTLKRDLSAAIITFDKKSFVYNGQQQGPAVTVKLDGKTLDASCYTVKNGTAKDVGTYTTLSIEGTGAYTGTVTAKDSYTITPKELTFDTSDLYATKAFDGNEHCFSQYVTGTLKLSGVVEGDDPGFTHGALSGSFESEKAGVQKVTFGPAMISAAITNKNYTLKMDQFTCNGEILAPLTSPDEVTGKNGEEVLVTADPGIKEVPATLQADPALNTPAKVENKMEEVTKLAITEPTAGVSIDDSKVTVRVMDIKLLVKTTSGGVSSGWNDKSAESSKYVDVIPVMIPYSQLGLTFEKAQALNFAVKHMITAAALAGQIETPNYEVRPNGLYFELTSLSPVAIAYRDLASITFDANGGNVSESQVLTNRDDKIGNMPNVSRDGYDFRGWYTEDGKLVDGNTILLENTKLIAKWERSTGDAPASAPAAPVDTTPTYFTVNAWVTTGGTVSPIGTTTYKQGVNTTYTMTPAPGYRIVKVVVDGVDVGAVNSYTFNYMNRNHEVGVYFDKATGTAAVRSSSIPQTSDASPLMLWVVLMAVSAVGIGGFFVIRRKKQ